MKNWIKIAMKANLNGNFLLSSENKLAIAIKQNKPKIACIFFPLKV